MLHVTNGTSVSLGQSGLAGEVLVWADVLHEGPVPAELSLEELSRLRGAFLDALWPGQLPAGEELARRDRTLLAHDEIVLWFEHDLYDQLQLIQILDCLRGRPVRTELIGVDRYLGPLTGAQLAELWPYRKAVAQGQFDLARAAWAAFRSPDPTGIEGLLRAGTEALPFLEGALLRHLEQFPSVRNGLARTERQILELVDAGERAFPRLFRADQQKEERIFMGDSVFLLYLRGLCDCRQPLLRESGGEYEVTETGREVLAGRADQVRLNGIHRWLGGVHLEGSEARWRWDETARSLRPN